VAAVAMIPRPVKLQSTVGGTTTVKFRAETRWVPKGHCFFAEWEIEGVRAAYLDGQQASIDPGIVGKDKQTICMAENELVLRLVLPDGTVHQYPLVSNILMRGEYWLFMSLAAINMLLLLGSLNNHVLTRPKWLALTGFSLSTGLVGAEILGLFWPGTAFWAATGSLLGFTAGACGFWAVTTPIRNKFQNALIAVVILLPAVWNYTVAMPVAVKDQSFGALQPVYGTLCDRFWNKKLVWTETRSFDDYDWHRLWCVGDIEIFRLAPVPNERLSAMIARQGVPEIIGYFAFLPETNTDTSDVFFGFRADGLRESLHAPETQLFVIAAVEDLPRTLVCNSRLVRIYRTIGDLLLIYSNAKFLTYVHPSWVTADSAELAADRGLWENDPIGFDDHWVVQFEKSSDTIKIQVATDSSSSTGLSCRFSELDVIE